MFTPSSEKLDEIISGLNPQDLPARFIVMAQVTNLEGEEQIVQGQALEELLDRHFDQISEIRIIVDVPLIRKTIMSNMAAVEAGLLETKS